MEGIRDGGYEYRRQMLPVNRVDSVQLSDGVKFVGFEVRFVGNSRILFVMFAWFSRLLHS